jgi:hypothetical protein
MALAGSFCPSVLLYLDQNRGSKFQLELIDGQTSDEEMQA